MFFTPGTKFYEENKHKLIHKNWEKYDGHVVHYPENIKPYELQQEIIIALKKIYSVKRLLKAILFSKGIFKILFIGEFFWQREVIRNYKKEVKSLKNIEI